MHDAEMTFATFHVAQSMLGGSLCEIIDIGTLVHKLYRGEIYRGHQKLYCEHTWFELVPNQVRKNYPYLFPETFLRSRRGNGTALGLDSQSETSLYVQKFDRRALSKLIMSGVLNTSDALAWFNIALELLTEIVYPLRTKTGYQNLYPIYHEPRLKLAVDALRNHDTLRFLFEPHPIIINGTQIPSLHSFVNWLEGNSIKNVLGSKHLVCMHGNLHPDNILIADRLTPTRDGITFIDPRGDILGPLYYDTAKIMTSLHSRYDEIHYGTYAKKRIGPREFEISFTSSADKIYTALLNATRNKMSALADFIKEDKLALLRATLLCQVIHTISFSFYHLKRFNPNIDRVETFLLSACYLAGKAKKLLHSGEEMYTSRLNFNEPI
jgi:hypothetical protein